MWDVPEISLTLALAVQSITGERVYSLYDGGEKTNGTRHELAAVIYTHERAAAGTINEPKMVRRTSFFVGSTMLAWCESATAATVDMPSRTSLSFSLRSRLTRLFLR